MANECRPELVSGSTEIFIPDYNPESSKISIKKLAREIHKPASVEVFIRRTTKL